MKINVKYFTDIEPLKILPNGDWVDLRAADDVMMEAGEFRLIPLGVAMELPEGYEAYIAPRSSTYMNFKIIQANHIAIIDNSYSGDNDQWMFEAIAFEDTKIPKGSRICQFRIMRKQPEIQFEAVEHLTGKDRGGFGTTGKV